MDTLFLIGASSGIGLQLARIYAPTHRVLTFQRRPCPLAGVESCPLDVTHANAPALVLDALSRVRAQGDEVCALVYAAGTSLSIPFDRTDPALAEELFATNFFGYTRLLHALLPRLSPGTRVVALSSLASILPIPYDPFYSASKAALNAFNQALGVEYPAIRFLSVLVGGTATNFSYKRVIAPRTAPRHDAATAALQYVEQHGKSAATVAGGIALLLDAPLPPPRPTIGALNVLLKGVERCLPTRWKLALTRLFFFRFPRLLARTPFAPKLRPAESKRENLP